MLDRSKIKEAMKIAFEDLKLDELRVISKAAEGWELVQIDRWPPYSGVINGNMGYKSAKYIFRRPAK